MEQVAVFEFGPEDGALTQAITFEPVGDDPVIEPFRSSIECRTLERSQSTMELLAPDGGADDLSVVVNLTDGTDSGPSECEIAFGEAPRPLDGSASGCLAQADFLTKVEPFKTGDQSGFTLSAALSEAPSQRVQLRVKLFFCYE